MKIDENTINHNLIEVIGWTTADLHAIPEESATQALMCLATIDGAMQLADRLKEVLKA